MTSDFSRFHNLHHRPRTVTHFLGLSLSIVHSICHAAKSPSNSKHWNWNWNFASAERIQFISCCLRRRRLRRCGCQAFTLNSNVHAYFLLMYSMFALRKISGSRNEMSNGFSFRENWQLWLGIKWKTWKTEMFMHYFARGLSLLPPLRRPLSLKFEWCKFNA